MNILTLSTDADREFAVAVFTKRFLTHYLLGGRTMECFKLLEEDPMMKEILPEVFDDLHKVVKGTLKAEKFWDNRVFSVFYRQVIAGSVDSGDIAAGFRNLLACASFEAKGSF